MRDTQQGFRLTVLRRADGVDCTNGGVSSRVTTITVLPIGIGEGLPELFAPTPDAPAFVIDQRYGHVFLRPAAACPRNLCGYMMGGNYAVACDSRWTLGALPIHDRTETAEQSRSNSI